VRLLARLVAATALAVAATPALAVVGGPAVMPSASAAACEGAGGVTVVVDGTRLPEGGGVLQECVGSGGTADTLFRSAGVAQFDNPSSPGFVCYVNDRPARKQCGADTQANSYWSLWWSDGESGTWQYSGLGYRSLDVPDGGYVAWAWQNRGSRTPPQVSAAPRASADPGSGAGGGSGAGSGGNGSGSGGSGGAGSGSGSGGSGSGGSGNGSGNGGGSSGGNAPSPSTPGSPGASAVPSPGATSTATPPPSTPPTTAPTDPAATTSSAAPGEVATTPVDPDAAEPSATDEADPAETSGGLPWWVALVALLGLGGAGAAVVLVRRRSTGPGPLL